MKISGTKARPRLSVFFSNSHVYAQLINDEKANTLAWATDLQIPKKSKGGKTEAAFEVGKLIAQKGADLKIESVVFDRGGFKYHGVVKALAQGAREGGLKF